jgi:hypothetical protein
VSGQAAFPLFERRRLQAAAHVRLLLAGYGVLVALFGVAWWDSSLSTSGMVLLGTRQTQLPAAQQVLDAGGPPLVAANVPYEQALRDPSQFYPANRSDDPGIYLYLPVFGHVTGDKNPLSQLKWFFIGCMALVLLMYPLVFYLLFDSRAVALAAPLVVLFGFSFLENRDIYFIEAWAILFGVPLLMLAARGQWRRRSGLALLAVAALAASFANSVRGHAGTGVALAALAVVLLREHGWRWRAGGAAIVVAAYVAIFPLGFKALTTYSYHHVHMPKQTEIATHPLWHSMYLGLGYLHNKWGIQWNDSVGIEKAAEIDPTAPYLSPRYEQILRHQYFRIVEDDPGYVARVYALKAAADLAKVWRHFWLPLLVLPFVLVWGRARRELRRDVLLAAPATLFALVPPILTLPDNYDTGFLGGVGFLAFLGGIGAFLALRDWRAEHRDVDFHALLNDVPVAETLVPVRAALASWRRDPRGRPVIVAAAVVLLIVLGTASVAAADSVSTEAWYQRRASLLGSMPPGAVVVQRWSGASLVTTWRRDGDVAVSAADGGSQVTTTPAANALQLISPGVRLAPATYAVIVDGTPLHGGIEIGSMDTKTTAWIAGSYYWSGQVGYGTKRMLVEFTLSAPEETSIALAAWARHDTPSTWELRSLELAKLPSG